MIRSALRRALVWALRPDPAADRVTGEAIRLTKNLRTRHAHTVPVVAFLSPDQAPILAIDAASISVTRDPGPDMSDSAGA